MSHNNRLQACGSVWTRTHCIPMGGSFSAQSADLHSSWALYECRRLLRSLGDLHLTDSGFPYWENSLGRVTMCQFRDNILVASSYPDCTRTKLIRNICQALGTAWNLSVLCECRSAKLPCEGHTSSVTAMGFCMVRGSDGMGLAYVHPNALSHSWDLKQGAPLKNPRAQHQGYVTAIITGALAAGAPWCTTWAGQLLSVSAWCQVAILSGYEHKRVARWARTYACTPHTSEKTAGYIHQHIKFFPRQRCCHVWAILQWPQTHAF